MNESQITDLIDKLTAIQADVTDETIGHVLDIAILAIRIKLRNRRADADKLSEN